MSLVIPAFNSSSDSVVNHPQLFEHPELSKHVPSSPQFAQAVPHVRSSQDTAAERSLPAPEKGTPIDVLPSGRTSPDSGGAADATLSETAAG